MANNNGRENLNPAFQFYSRDFWSSARVANMTGGEIAVYLRLLCECDMQNGLPDDFEELTLIAGSARMRPKAFEKSWDRILKRCFIEHEGRLWNPRMLRERGVTEDLSEKRSDAGVKGAKARWEKERLRKEAKAEATACQDAEMAKDGTGIAKNGNGMANDSSHPIPSHPTNTLAGVTRPPAREAPPAGDPPEDLPASLARAPAKLQSEYRVWAQSIDGFLSRDQVSLAGSRILLDALEYRCAVADNLRSFGLPRLELDWLTLAREVDKDHERARSALEQLKSGGGFKFSNYLSKVDDDRGKASAQGQTAYGAPRTPGSGQNILKGISMGLKSSSLAQSSDPRIAANG